MKFLFLSLVLGSHLALADYDQLEKDFGKSSINFAGYRKTILSTVDSGFPYSALPWIKDYLVKSEKGLDREISRSISKVVSIVGIKPFESLPDSALKKLNDGHFLYILAKRQLKAGKANIALELLKSLPQDDAYPFLLNLKATALTVAKQDESALSTYKECIEESQSQISSKKSQVQFNQMMMNRDYCIAGVARVKFSQGKYQEAELAYLDLKKESFVWPEILFEEAWTSYYLKNYNRTLGKLISYRAPVFDFIVNPEIEILKAMTYFRMCLYDDAKKVVDSFYQDYLTPSRDLRAYVLKAGNDYSLYFNLMADFEDGKSSGISVLDESLRSIRKDAAYRELKANLVDAIAELNRIRKLGNSSLAQNLSTNTKTVIGEFKTSLGAYIRSSLVTKYSEFYKAFENMSYIKLEVLAMRKERIYQQLDEVGKKRGDVKYIDRNDKQYFWTFNGEFWADELGDYVFALRSEC